MVWNRNPALDIHAYNEYFAAKSKGDIKNMRTSPIHYIAPSAMSIVPNCNGTSSDLAVNISRNTKIKVYSPRAGIDKTTDGEYQEWTITGRNRRLANAGAPYTIYLRLPKDDVSGGYLVFSEKVNRDGIFIDKWSYITENGLAPVGGIDDLNWYVRLGDVSLPDANNQRTVTLDTGILGTEQFNDEWALRPDELPLRIELGCTIGDEDAGPTPYVYWGQSIVLTAMLTEGWTGTDIQRFDHWEITRYSGDVAADNAWNHPNGIGSYRSMDDGSITLRHQSGADDFNRAVANTFNITAWGSASDGNGLAPLITAAINIHAETVAKMDFLLSSSLMRYDKKAKSFSPSGGVGIQIRSTNQRGDTSGLTVGQMEAEGLVVSYASAGTDEWTDVELAGEASAPAVANIPTSAFSAKQNLNVRLVRRTPATRSAGTADEELWRSTVGFVSDGVDGKSSRFYYFGGDYDGTPSHYYMEATQAPYVKMGNSFYMLDNGGEEPTLDAQGRWSPTTAPGAEGDTAWTPMSGQQQYYIARAFFGENAYLGSFIINGDWMLSQYGTLIDSSGTKTIVDDTNVNRQYNGKVPYVWFDATDPTASSNPQQDGYKFIPNFAVDGRSGKTYQNRAYIRGEVYAESGIFTNVIGYGGFRSPFSYVGPGETFSIGETDNMAVYSTSFNAQGTYYNIPWDPSQSGRKIVITNYKWGENGIQSASGFIRINAPTGKYFFEDGLMKSSIQLSREVVELIGYGDTSSFYGWIVLARADLVTEHRYGHKMKALAYGTVIVNGPTDISSHISTLDGSELPVTRVSEGKYKVDFGNNWFAKDSDVHVTVTGYGYNANGQRYASLHSMDRTGFEVWTGDDESVNEGSFTFIVMNMGDGIYLNMD